MEYDENIPTAFYEAAKKTVAMLIEFEEKEMETPDYLAGVLTVVLSSLFQHAPSPCEAQRILALAMKYCYEITSKEENENE